MIATIEKSILENAVSKMSSFLGKDVSNITSQILLDIKESSFKVVSNNREMGLSLDINNFSHISDGFIVVNGSRLITTVKAFKSGDIKIEIKDNNLVLSQSRTKFKIPMFSDIRYPKFPTAEDMDHVSVNADILAGGFNKILPCIDSNFPKYELTGALIDISNESIKMVATDTKRLSVNTISKGNEKELSLVIPKKAITEMLKTFNGEIDMSYSNEFLMIKSEFGTFYTKLISGLFPDYSRVVPKSTSISMELSTLLFKESIKQIMTVSEHIKIELNDKEIVFLSESNDSNDAKTMIEYDYTNDVKFIVNGRFLNDFLSSIDADTFTLKMNDSESPIVLESNEFMTVVMPIIG